MPTTTNPRRIRINPTARPLVEEVTWENLDPAERAVAEEVLTAMKAEFAVAATATTDDETTPFGRFLATRAPASRTAVRASARSLQAAPAAVLAKNFGRHVELVRPVVVKPGHRPRLKFDPAARAGGPDQGRDREEEGREGRRGGRGQGGGGRPRSGAEVHPDADDDHQGGLPVRVR